MRALLIFMIFIGFGLNAQEKDHTVINNVKIFDGYRLIPNGAIEIKDGFISKIYEKALSKVEEDVELINGKGKTVIPSMINAHVHLWEEKQLVDAQDNGIFMVMDMHSASQTAKVLKEKKRSPHFADYLTAGPAATVADGHGTQFGFEVPVIGAERSARQYVLDRLGKDVDFIKVIREPFKATLSFDQIDTIVHLAHENELLAVAHISKLEDALKVVELGMNGLTHIWYDREATSSDIDMIQDKGLFVIPTLSVISKVLEMGQQEGWGEYYLSLEEVLSEVSKLHQAGVRILAGTDSPNFEINYGDDFFHELELLSRCGMENIEVLKAATSNIADAFDVLNYGRVKVGHAANLVLIEGNPIQNIQDMYNIEAIYKNGIRLK